MATSSRDSAPVTLRAFVRQACAPRYLALLVVFLAVAALCARLGVWQLDRAFERAELSRVQEQAEAEAEQPPFLGEVLTPQTTFPGNLVGQRAVVTGEFVPETTRVVSGRTIGQGEGVLLVDALRVTDDGSAGASWAHLSQPPFLAVVRGWLPKDAVGDDGWLTDQWADVVVPPAGEVTVEGWLQASESTLPSDSAGVVVSSLSTAALANAWDAPGYGGYLVVIDSDPEQSDALTLLPRPTIEGGDGVNVQNFFYALQWWVFGLFAVALWSRLVVDAVKDQAVSVSQNPFAQLNAQAHDTGVGIDNNAPPRT